MKIAIALRVILVLFAISSLWSAQVPKEAPLPNHMVIRAQLIHKVSAAKAKPGNLVEMRALESEKDGEIIVIERDARLIGHVVAAAGRSESSSLSSLQIVIERAEWKGHSVPLNAFIVGQGQVLRTQTVPCNERSPGRNSSENNTPGFVLCIERGATISRTETSPLLKDVEIIYERGRSGPTVLVSKKANVVLPVGLVVIIRNVGKTPN